MARDPAKLEPPMNQPPTPTRLVLATDMSARCDRALARAWQLARAWNAELDVVHAVSAARVAHRDHLVGSVPSWRRSESWTSTLDRHLRADLAAEGISVSSAVIVGAPGEAVMEASVRVGASLIVLGIAKDARMDRIQLGSTVDSVVRNARVPVLNVRSRARSPYRHVVVATDFSDPAGQALALAARWFESATLTLFHAYLPPGSSMTTGTGANDSWRAAVTQLCDAHVASLGLPASALPPERRLLERGHAGALLSDYVAQAEVDLVVLGSQGRSGVARFLLGSTAEQLLHALDCDTLVVRGT